MTPKEKAMKWIKEQEFAFYTYATLEKILDIALKEQAKEIYSKLLKTTMEEYNYSILDLQKELLEKYT